MKAKIYLTLLCCNLWVLATAQKNIIFNIPASIPEPCWVKKIDWNKPNVFVIDSVIKNCAGIEHKEEEDDKAEKKNELEKEMNEEPYMMAYIRWRRYVQPFIKPDGDVIIDNNYYQKKLNETIQKQEVNNINKVNKNTDRPLGTLDGAANWGILGPNKTFSDKNGGLNNHQVNMYRLAISKSNPNIVYAGSETGVLFKSADKGLNWVAINDALLPGAVTAIAVSPSDANVVYAYSNGLIKTIDGGLTWSLLPLFSSGGINKIDINASTGRIIAAAVNGIFYSDDAGSTWTASTFSTTPGTQIFDLVINLLNPTLVYAVSASTATNSPMLLYISTNSGNTFTTVTLPANTYCKGARLAVTAADGNYVYCFTVQNDVPKLLKSTDAGFTWSVGTTFTGTSYTGTDNINGLSNGQGYYDQAIMVSPNNRDHVIVGTGSAFKSTDGGLNFTSVGGFMGPFGLHPDMQSMVALGNDAYITTDGGVNYSTDFFTSTANFSIRHKGLTGSDYWGFGQGWSEDLVVGGRYHNGNAALYENYGTGNSLFIGGAEDATGHVFPGPDKIGVVGFRDMGSFIIPPSLNEAITTAEVKNTLWPGEDYYGQFSSKLMIDPRYSNVFYLGKSNSLWKSQNNGYSYIELKNFGSAVWRFDIARSNPDIMIVCTTGGIFKTTDAGASWVQLTLPPGVNYQYYNSDIAISPTNDQQIWFSMAQGAGDSKAFKSADGGSTWINYTGTVLNAKAAAFILAQGGTNEGVYAVTNVTPVQVFYRDATMADWVNYSAGLPQNFTAREGGIIFYRDNKLRLAGSRGIWESPLFSSGAPVAQPMANKKYISCPRDTVKFGDYSMLTYSGASWQWSFPGASFISSATEREPKVLYPAPGNYNVSLTVTDARGRTSTKTINSMINFTGNNCTAEEVAGKSLVVNGTNTPVTIGTANINSNTFSLSCWIKPKGNQNSFAQLISHDPYPGSTYGFGLGFAFNSYTPSLRLCYTDNMVNYSNNSNLIADTTKWNNVVLTYSPTGVTIYLNGMPQIVNSNTMPVIDLSKSAFYINRDIHNQGGYYNGQIDEVKIYNYTLSQNEIRQKMHLIQTNGIAERGLLKYLQFNEFDANTGCVYELINGNSATLSSAASLAVSTAPVATGTSFLTPGADAGGHYNFTGTGVDMYFPATGAFPDNDLVAFRLNSLPDTLADTKVPVPANGYFIVNNFSTNAGSTPLQKITFSNLPINSGIYTASNFNLYKRTPTAFYGTEWANSLGTANSFIYGANNTSILEFTNSSISSIAQYTITNSNAFALPVSLISFSADAFNNTIVAKWLATNENLKKYELERSMDGTNFIYVATITAKNNTTDNVYNFTDATAQLGIQYYYRLKMIDNDGKFKYSITRSAILKNAAVSITDIAPNPSKGWSYINAFASVNQINLSIYIYDAAGRMVYKSMELLHKGQNTIMLNYTNLAQGIYFIKIYDNLGLVKESKLSILK